MGAFTTDNALFRGQIRCVLGPVQDAFTIEKARFQGQIRCTLGPVLGTFTIENARFEGQIRCLFGPVLDAFTIEIGNARFRIRFGVFWDPFWTHSRLETLGFRVTFGAS